MITETQSGHISFLFQNDESVFDLGYKVLQKQQINHTLSGIRVSYNLKDKMMYDVENLHSIESCYSFLDNDAALKILISMLQVIRDVAHNGFIHIEAVQISPKYIFWNQEEKKAYFIVLPIAGEIETNDYRSWNKRVVDTIHALVEKTDALISEMIMDEFNKEGRLTQQVDTILKILEQREVCSKTEKDFLEREKLELQLIHQGMYGHIVLRDLKKEYVIGKRRDSVDGYINVSDAVSRIHCKIIRRQNKFFITDLGSSNHTYVNSTMVYPRQEKELADGSRVRIADIDFFVKINEGDLYDQNSKEKYGYRLL